MASPAARPTLPPTMRAWTYTSRGPPSKAFTLTTVPTPVPSTLTPTDIIVHVSHVALTIGMIVAYSLFPHPTSKPWVPEMEFTGTIVATGSSVSEFEIGDEIIALRSIPEYLKYGGGLAEYVVSSTNVVAKKPKNMSMAQSIGISGYLTALQAVELAGVKKGDKVLVTGASGSLGNVICQWVRQVVGESGRVVGTCSGRNEELVKGLGVDEVIDYTKHPQLHEYVKQKHGEEPFDVIFDCVGDYGLHQNCPSYLKTKGFFCLLGAMDEVDQPTWWGLLSWIIPAKLEQYRPVVLGGIPRRHRMYNALPNGDDLRKVVKLAEEGKVIRLVDSVWNMEDALKGYEKMYTKRARGKVVIEVQKNDEWAARVRRR